MAAVNCHGLVDGKDYELTIGSSFQPNRSKEAFYTMRYDFKPASVDTSQPAELSIGSKNECTLNIPNHESGMTTYKGGKKPCTKECILIIDQDTGEITLERITANIPLKKHRVDRSNDAPKLTQTKPPPSNVTKTKTMKQSKPATNSPVTKQPKQQTKPLNNNAVPKPAAVSNQAIPTKPIHSVVAPPQSKLNMGRRSMSVSSDSSSSSDSSDSEDENTNQEPEVPKAHQPPPLTQESSQTSSSGGGAYMSTLQSDLQLSDSNSESD